LGNLDKPICIALVTLEGLEGSDTEEANEGKPLNGEENQTHLVSVIEKMATKVKDGTTTTGEEGDDDNDNDLSTVKNDNNDPTSTAFKFGINGVQQLPMSGGHKCADSLDAQEEMATLIQGIVTALKNKKVNYFLTLFLLIDMVPGTGIFRRRVELYYIPGIPRPNLNLNSI
jgi:hypothetical protein